MKLSNLSWLPALIIMIIIFMFSAKPADNSNESSKTIANFVLNIMENLNMIDDTLLANDRDDVLNNINHIVRKLAHFMEYALLAMAIEFHMWVRKRRGVRLILLSIIFTSLYAATDEFHQLFVPGRSGELKDVIIDSAGAIAGTFSFYLAILIINHYRSNRKNSDKHKPAIIS